MFMKHYPVAINPNLTAQQVFRGRGKIRSLIISRASTNGYVLLRDGASDSAKEILRVYCLGGSTVPIYFGPGIDVDIGLFVQIGAVGTYVTLTWEACDLSKDNNNTI